VRRTGNFELHNQVVRGYPKAFFSLYAVFILRLEGLYVLYHACPRNGIAERRVANVLSADRLDGR
jgi:hypothetical protein